MGNYITSNVLGSQTKGGSGLAFSTFYMTSAILRTYIGDSSLLLPSAPAGKSYIIHTLTMEKLDGGTTASFGSRNPNLIFTLSPEAAVNARLNSEPLKEEIFRYPIYNALVGNGWTSHQYLGNHNLAAGRALLLGLSTSLTPAQRSTWRTLTTEYKFRIGYTIESVNL